MFNYLFTNATLIDITYELELEEWVRLNASKAKKGLVSVGKETFIDKNGVKRYTDSWFPVKEPDESTFKQSEEEAQQKSTLDFEKTGITNLISKIYFYLNALINIYPHLLKVALSCQFKYTPIGPR